MGNLIDMVIVFVIGINDQLSKLAHEGDIASHLNLEQT